MKRTYYDVSRNGFYGAYWPCRENTDSGLILMLGDDIDDLLAKAGVKWLHDQKCNVLTMAPAKHDYGHHEYPLERIEEGIRLLKAKGNVRIGIAGASTTGMLAMTAASLIPEITLTIAISPSDFVMEGFYRDGLDGCDERPSGSSSLSFRGKPLPYLPYAYRHPEYWQKLKEEAAEGKDMAASRKMFDLSEQLHPLQEEEKIRVENIRGIVCPIGCEDDVLWDTCRYIRRMEDRLREHSHTCIFEPMIYEHGTHFAFPEGMIRKILPFGDSLLVSAAFKAGREYPKECRRTRDDIEERLVKVLENWKTQ